MRVSPDSFPSILPTDNQSRHYGLRVLGGSEEGTAATARGDNNDPLLAGSTDAVAGAGAGYSRGGGWADPPAHHSNNGNGDRGTAVSDIARSSLTRSSDENRGSSGAAMRQPGGERRSSSKEVKAGDLNVTFRIETPPLTPRSGPSSSDAFPQDGARRDVWQHEQHLADPVMHQLSWIMQLRHRLLTNFAGTPPNRQDQQQSFAHTGQLLTLEDRLAREKLFERLELVCCWLGLCSRTRVWWVYSWVVAIYGLSRIFGSIALRESGQVPSWKIQVLWMALSYQCVISGGQISLLSVFTRPGAYKDVFVRAGGNSVQQDRVMHRVRRAWQWYKWLVVIISFANALKVAGRMTELHNTDVESVYEIAFICMPFPPSMASLLFGAVLCGIEIIVRRYQYVEKGILDKSICTVGQIRAEVIDAKDTSNQIDKMFSNFSTIFLLFNAAVVVFALNTLLFNERSAQSRTSSIIFFSLTICATVAMCFMAANVYGWHRRLALAVLSVEEDLIAAGATPHEIGLLLMRLETTVAAITILGGKVRLRPSLMLRATSTVVSVFFLTYYTQTKILALQEKGQM